MSENMNPPENLGLRQSAPLDYVVFALGEQEYGFESSRVRQSDAGAAIAPATDASGLIRSAITAEGIEVPVIDLRRHRGTDAATANRRNLVMVQLDQRMVGVLVDSPPERISLNAEQVRPLSDLPQV